MPLPLEQKHKHLNDLQILEFGEKASEGRLDAIVICDECRQKIGQAMEYCAPDQATPSERKWLELMIGQMELDAFFFKTAIERALKEGGGILTDLSERRLDKTFGSRKIIGEIGNGAFEKPRITPIEIPIDVSEFEGTKNG